MVSEKELLFRKIKRLAGQAIADFDMISDGDRIAVGVSGGKDSLALLLVLKRLREKAPVNFSIVAVHIDSGFPGARLDILEKFLKEEKIEYTIERTSFFEIMKSKKDPDSGYCAICSRLRRGFLYTVAHRLGCNKIALGHHLDDFIETLLLNTFYSGCLASMGAKLHAENGFHTVIRPFVYVEERDLEEFALKGELPVIPCPCPEQDSEEQKRKKMKNLIKELSGEIPEIRASVLGALMNVKPDRLLDVKLLKSLQNSSIRPVNE